MGTLWRRAIGTVGGRLVLLLGALAVVWLVTAAIDHYLLGLRGSFGAALWSSLLHLLDPSTLQDDEGTGRRIVGLVQVVFGLVFLVGVLFTVVSEVIGSTLQRAGQTSVPVRARDHVVVIGGEQLLVRLVGDFAGSEERVPQHDRDGLTPSRIVAVLPGVAREQGGAREAALRRAGAGAIKTTVLYGDPADPATFDLAAVRHAGAVIVLPGVDLASPEESDDQVVQIGLALRAFLGADGDRARPRVVCVFRIGDNADAARDLLPRGWQAVVGDRSFAALLRIAATRPRFTPMLPGISGRVDARLVLRSLPALDGVPFREVFGRVEDAIPLGIMRHGRESHQVRFAPGPDERAAPGDQFILLSPGSPRLRDIPIPVPEPVPIAAEQSAIDAQRILLVGWNISLRAFVRECARQRGAPVKLFVLAPDTPSLDQALGEPRPGLTVERIAGDWLDPVQVAAAVAAVAPDTVIVGSTPMAGGMRTADARARLAALQAARVEGPHRTRILLALFFPADERIAPQGEGPVAADAIVLSTLRLLSRTLVHAVRAPHWGQAAEELLGSGSTVLDLVEYRPADGAPATFGAVYQGLLAQATVPLGIASATVDADVNPPHNALVQPGDGLLVVRRIAP